MLRPPLSWTFCKSSRGWDVPGGPVAKTPHFLVQFQVGNQIPHATTKFASHRTKDGVKILRATIQIGRSQINKNKIIKEIKTESSIKKKKKKSSIRALVLRAEGTPGPGHGRCRLVYDEMGGFRGPVSMTLPSLPMN